MPDLPHHLAALWPLRSDVTFLNHGSFGACPEPVLDSAHAWTRRLVREPCEFFQRDSPDLLAVARARLATFLGAGADDLVYLPNSTTAANVVATTLASQLSAGDQILLTDHEYGAVTRLWRTVCQRQAAQLVIAPLPWPLATATTDEIVTAITSAITPRTRLLMVSHVTSPTAVVLPVMPIVAAAHQRGVPVAIDGAHAPGMFPLNLTALGADYYFGNCHKWLCAPVGSGFLFRHPGSGLPVPQPLIISWGQRPGRGCEPQLWQAEFEWSGTHNFAPYLATPTAIDFLETTVGWTPFVSHTRELIAYAVKRLSQIDGVTPLRPSQALADGPANLTATMAAFALPPGDRATLQNGLWHRFRIEVPITDWNGRRLLRVSAHMYNHAGHIDRLAVALPEALADCA